jgi:CRISPR-associated endonuclease Cas1
MAASGTLPQPVFSRKSPIGRRGVLTLFGYGIKVRMQCGHLEIEDGIGPERRKIRLARVGHGLKRLVIIGSDGFVSLDAMRWLADQDASLVMLERDGKVLFTTGPVRPSEAKLRRAQALAHSSGAALRIASELISRKLDGQEQVARHSLLDASTGDVITRFRADLPTADSISTIRLIESQAARAYWSAWSTLPVNFPKNQVQRLPAHWLTFGARVSPLTGSPRLACNPPNAFLNYLYALLEAESRLAAAAMGLDPGLGVLHTDMAARDSLACDLMEPCRAAVDAYVLEWITKQTLNREWFAEQRDGNCRLIPDCAARLSETAYIWRRHVAPVAEWVASAFWSTIRRPDAPIATRLTQNNKRTAKGSPTQPLNKRFPSQQNVCLVCGKPIEWPHRWCYECAQKNSTASLIEGAPAGRVSAQTATAKARRKETKRLHDLARANWSPSDQPSWLTEDLYKGQIQPRLVGATLSAIASAIGVSIPYASDIRKGRRRPHARHWQPLAALVGIIGLSSPGCSNAS